MLHAPLLCPLEPVGSSGGVQLANALEFTASSLLPQHGEGMQVGWGMVPTCEFKSVLSGG